jgi:hypothetical protein
MGKRAIATRMIALTMEVCNGEGEGAGSGGTIEVMSLLM